MREPAGLARVLRSGAVRESIGAGLGSGVHDVLRATVRGSGADVWVGFEFPGAVVSGLKFDLREVLERGARSEDFASRFFVFEVLL